MRPDLSCAARMLCEARTDRATNPIPKPAATATIATTASTMGSLIFASHPAPNWKDSFRFVGLSPQSPTVPQGSETNLRSAPSPAAGWASRPLVRRRLRVFWAEGYAGLENLANEERRALSGAALFCWGLWECYRMPRSWNAATAFLASELP